MMAKLLAIPAAGLAGSGLLSYSGTGSAVKVEGSTI